MEYVSYFFAGAFLCNCIPHLVAGLQGRSFPTPFARPRGTAKSSPLVNFFWGTSNLAAAAALLVAAPIHLALDTPLYLFCAGWLILGAYLTKRFGAMWA